MSSTTTTTVLTADAAAAADAALAQQLSDLTARVTALEQGSVTPPIPPGPTPSPDGAKATGPGTILVDDALNQWQLAADPALGNVVLWLPKGGAAWGTAGYSANVTAIEKFKATCYQTNGTGWWSWDGTTWQTAPGDPSGTTPPTPIPPVTNANVLVDLTKPGAAVTPYVWGFSTGAIADNGFALLADKNCRASIAKLKPTLLRINANEQLPRAWATGNTGIMDNLFNNLSIFDPALRLVIGTGPTNQDTSISVAQWASWSAAFATHLKTIGKETLYYEVGNECDGMSVANYNAFFNAIADALHGVNPKILVGGTNASWWGGTDLAGWVSGCGSRIGFGAFHGYPGNTQTSMPDFYAKALSMGGGIQAMRAQLPTVEIGQLEYNMSGDYTNPDARMGQMPGAIYAALGVISNINADPLCTMNGLWDAAKDGAYGAVGNEAVFGGDLTTITPQGWVLGVSGQLMRGARVPIQINLPNVSGLAVKTASGGSATMLCNYGTAAQTVTLGITGGAASNATRTELSAAAPNTVNVALASLSGVALPAQSIVWVTG